jgi:hypothetical protein
MGSVSIVILDVILHQSVKVLLVQDNNMIEQIPATIADPSFRYSVLPGAANVDLSRFDSQGF